MTRMTSAEIGLEMESDTSRTRTRPYESVAFYLLLAVLILPVVLFDIFPSQDGAAHVGNGAIYVDVGESILDTYFEVQVFPLVPNVLADLVIGVMQLFLAPFLAERLFVLALVVGVPLGLRWCVSEVNPESTWLSLLALPLGASLVLYFGFYGFLLGVVLSLFGLGLWLRAINRGAVRWPTVIGLGVVAFLVYLSHPLPLLGLILFMSAASFDAWLVVRSDDRAGGRAIVTRHASAIALTASVPLVLLAIYALDQEADAEYGRSLIDRLVIFPADSLVTYSSWEIPFAILLTLGVALLAVLAVWRSESSAIARPGFLVATLLLTATYLISPNEIGPGGVVLPRIAMLITISALLWLASVTFPEWARRAVLAIAIFTTVGLTLVRIPHQNQLHADMEDFATGLEVIAPESTVLPFWGIAEPDDRSSRVFFGRRTWSGYLMATTESVDFSHFPAYVDAFPVEFRAGYDIQAASSGGAGAFVLGDSALVDAPAYERATQGEIDYVMFWDRESANRELVASTQFDALTNWLDTEYERVFISPKGLLEIYARSS